MSNDNDRKIWENLKVPDIEEQYKKEAEKLLKMINEQMQFYYNHGATKYVDILELHQIIRKIEKFESNVYGIAALKNELIEDMHTLIQHFEKKIREEQRLYSIKYNNLKEEIEALTKENNKLILLIVLFQWYLYPKYKKTESKLASLKKQLKHFEYKEQQYKRTMLNTEQLIKIAYGFREKYLNVKPPTENSSQE